MQEYLHQTADAGVYQTADAGYTLLGSGCRGRSIRQRMQETLNQIADAGISLSDSGCKRLYHTADAGVSPSDSGCRRLSIRLSDRETPASAV